MTHYAKQLLDKAKVLAIECDYSLEEALGDVLACVLWHVDAEMYKDGDRLPMDKNSLFYKQFMEQVNRFFE
jgi:hypothetical protein